MVKRLMSDGRYTLVNRATGEHRTFEVKTMRANDPYWAGKTVVGILDGPQNTSDYRAFALLLEDRITVFKRNRGQDGKRSNFEWYAEMLFTLAVDGAFSRYADRYSIMMEERCWRCGRPLTTPESIRAGIGPICASAA